MGQKRSASEARLGARKPDRPSVQDGPKPSRKPSSAQDALICAPLSAWHTADLPALGPPSNSQPLSPSVVEALHDYATTLLEADNKAYSAANVSSSSSNKFLSSIMSSGTLEDKISALTLMVQESPLHTIKSFENLLGLARKKNRNQALMAMAALKDLLAQSNVIPDRKLHPFAKQPGLLALSQTPMRTWKQGVELSGGLTKTHLVTWAFEDWLKKQYFDLLKILEGWTADEVEFSRSRAVTIVYELLRDKPEQEENLLRLLVNKLGDTANKIASRTSYLLLQLQNSHPAMKPIIVKAVESDCMFRPGQILLARYYAVITLNQTILGKNDEQLASQLLDIYFTLFVQLLKIPIKSDAIQPQYIPPVPQQGGGGKAGKMAAKKAKAQERTNAADDQLRDKMVAQVLAGVNRAFPFADLENPKFEQQMESLFRVAHSSNFSTSIQALMLIQRLSSVKQYASDRFYRTVYESLLDPRLLTSSKQNMYLNLLFRSLKSDINAKRVQAFVKRLLQTINMHDPPFVCGVLYLVLELKKTFPAITNMTTEPELDAEDEDEHFVDAPEHQNVTISEHQQVISPRPIPKDQYDARKRDPAHSNAEKSALWDILPMCMHFHPSVSLFADALAHGLQTPPKPDPSLHTLIHFLDRFVYRNPKSKAHLSRGASIMQPMAGSRVADLLIKSKSSGHLQAPVNSEAFLNRDITKIDVDEVFFHKYFNQANKTKPASRKRTRPEGSDAEDEEEDDIWKALVDSNKDIEGPDEDDDLSIGDLESAYSDSDDDQDAESAADGLGDVEIADFPDEDDDADGVDDDNSMPNLDDDEDALLDDEDEIPIDIVDDAEAEAGKDADADLSERKKKRRKIKSLPTFASAEDYAAMLDEPDEY